MYWTHASNPSHKICPIHNAKIVAAPLIAFSSSFSSSSYESESTADTRQGSPNAALTASARGALAGTSQLLKMLDACMRPRTSVRHASSARPLTEQLRSVRPLGHRT
eukprot:gnl/TRDRNA2_/TRDRNA2_164577_c6_seq1.p1 gnl/TRDRNA2_/TRDRNA2_164577_c6~~gnl/TRDRNA2_/TRDRNA2_164577_c6_seq1.p1  ORF type:complete len:107 (-),score=2.58 gnl/TRDRNA2_/TRDRNA2_164577_c6_seq1:113-433(-)